MPNFTKIDITRDSLQYPNDIVHWSGSTSIGQDLFVKNIEIDTATPLYGDVLIYDGLKFKAGNSSFFNDRVVAGMGITIDPSNSLKYNIALGQYIVGGQQYYYSGGSVTILTGDTSLSRFDVFYISSSQTASVLTGQNGASPLVPTLTTGQLSLGIILVPAGYNSGTTGSTIFNPTVTQSVFSYNTGYTGAIQRTDGNSLSSGNFSIAFSRESESKGQDSIALGIGTIASGTSQSVFGKYNIEDPNSIIIIGVGASNISRKNALTINNDGDVLVPNDFFVKGIEITTSATTKFGQVLSYDGEKYKPQDVFIGNAEDNTYTDGLFTDFLSTSTTIGTAVDRFNQILKALVPSPSPNLSYISGNTFSSGYLSFGVSKSIPTFSNVTGITPNGTTSLDLNGLFQVNGISNRRLGILNQNSSNIIQTLNANVTQSTQTPTPSYSAYSFNDGNIGIIEVQLNGNVINILNLSTTTSATSSVSGNSIVNVSAVYNNKFGSGVDFTFSSYRVGTLLFMPSASTNGWNYLRVSHIVNGTPRYTNFVDWVYDPNLTPINLITSSLSNPIMGGSKYLSGVRYTTSGTSQYNSTVSNIYTNVYATTPITFNLTSLTLTTTYGVGSGTTLANGTTNLTLPLLLTSGNSEQSILNLTGLTSISATRLLGSTAFIAVNSSYPHVFSTKTLNNTGLQTKVGFLHYNINSSNTYKLEDFNDETKRMQDGDYSAITYNLISSTTYIWDSTLSITSTTPYNTGLLQYNGTLTYPNNSSLPNSGNFANSNLTYSYYLTNPNYSIVTGEKVYYIRFKKSIAGSMSSFNILISATASTPLTTPLATVSSNNIAVELLVCYQNNNKSPWLSLAGNSGSNNWNGAGTASFSFGSSSLFSLGTNPTLELNDILLVRIRTSSTWTGTITGMQITDSNF